MSSLAAITAPNLTAWLSAFSFTRSPFEAVSARSSSRTAPPTRLYIANRTRRSEGNPVRQGKVLLTLAFPHGIPTGPHPHGDRLLDARPRRPTRRISGFTSTLNESDAVLPVIPLVARSPSCVHGLVHDSTALLPGER